MRKGEGKRGSKLRILLSTKFLEDLLTIYQETGIGAIRSMRQEEPTKFCIMLANLLPKEISMDIANESKITEMTDEQVNELIVRLESTIRERTAEAESGSEAGPARPAIH
jgi:hypothetical protein